MLSNHLKTSLLRLFLVSLTALFLSYCVPVKKQLILKDLNKKTLKALRTTDTTLLYQPFEYKLKTGDILAINLVSFAKGEYDLSSLSQQGNISVGGNRGGGGAQVGNTGYIINDSGYVIFPVLGRIKVSGLNIKEAQLLVQQKVDAILANTTANISMLNYYVYLLGEISTQGQVFAQSDRITLLEAIANAGGFTDFTDRSNIKIVRNQNNTAHIYYVDLSDQNFITKQQVYLLPNDIVVFEPLRAKVTKTYTIPNISLIITSLTLFLTLTLTFSNLLNRR